MVKHIIGDVFESGADIILHQVNCQGVMGSGVAAQVKVKYPLCYAAYRILCSNTTRETLLGHTQIYIDDTGTKIGNLFAQDKFGYDGKCYTDYDALKECLNAVNQKYRNNRVAIPYLMGCHRGGGDWNIVYELIEECLKDCEVEIYEYRI